MPTGAEVIAPGTLNVTGPSSVKARVSSRTWLVASRATQVRAPATVIRYSQVVRTPQCCGAGWSDSSVELPAVMAGVCGVEEVLQQGLLGGLQRSCISCA